MSSFFTTEDANNLKILVDQHKVIYRRNVLLSRAPHIATNTILTVQKCTDEYEYRDPLYVPPADDYQLQSRRDLEDLAIAVDWKFTPTGCDHMVSCNPFYPKSKRCKGMPKLSNDPKNNQKVDSVVGEVEQAFSFRTLNNQVFDACQPMCYDESASTVDNLVGVMSRFTFGKCRVYDPMMLAFYTDPTRRYVNPDTQILERKAMLVRDVLIEPTKEAVLLASIPNDYCDQYGGTYKPDGRLQEMDMYKCGDNALVWSTSWLIGDSLPKLASLGYDKALPYLTSGQDWVREEENRYPPTKPFLVSRDKWLNNTDGSKRTLPFPLRLSELGIHRGTATEWLVWTDEFSNLSDGRNDKYGGRLVERVRPITGIRDPTTSAADAARVRNMTAGGRFGYTDPRTGVRRESSTLAVSDSNEEKSDVQFQSSMLKLLSHGVQEYQNILNQRGDKSHIGALSLGAGLAYGIGYEYLAHKTNLPSSFSVVKSVFTALRRAPAYARKVPLKVVGFWAAKAVTAHTVESAVVRTLTNRLKCLAFSPALGPLAVVIDVLSLIGLAIDITFVLLHAFGVSTPVSRRENYVSDRRLYRLAQTEIEFNHRLYGTGNIELTPSRFLVNTPFLTAEEDVQSHMAVMPIVYAARELNSNGGLLKPDRQTGEGEFIVNEDGTINYLKNHNSLHKTIVHEEEISSVVDQMLQSSVHIPVPLPSETEEKNILTKNVTQYFAICLFIATCLIGYFYPRKNWTIVVGFMVTILSVLFPLVYWSNTT